MSAIRIRLAAPSDCEQLSRLRQALWPESSAEEHRNELAAVLGSKQNGTLPLAILVAEAPDGALAGFLEAGLRSHADGCDPTRPVGFLEGWFVAKGHRGKNLGRRLLLAAEEWARGKGCIEMASDTQIDNALSQQVHEALGFQVIDRCVHYRKVL
jgi:aminoglycoside 6'-N-acetyltransferase I